ncbi:MAG: hypothetical protein K8W52_09975 [Deltaproteobacteria bacterium]|nr:hypothetical protein [Deltaproteobacteria bacterium]
MGEDDEQKALATIAPVPPLVRAKDLASATAGTVVYIDRRGQVRSWRRVQARQIAVAGAFGLSALYLVAFGGAFGLAWAAITGGFVAFRTRQVRQLTRGFRLLTADRIDEARVVFEDLSRQRIPPRLQALVEQNLAACHARRSEFEPALDQIRDALAWHARSGNRQPHATTAAYAEVGLLVELGRTAEARTLFAQRFPHVPDGDYLRVLHWLNELNLCFAEGTHALSPDELHDRARVALGMTSSAGLLGLLAWAHHHLGDLDQAWHLLREAEDRREPRLERTAPRLHAWMVAHRDEAQAAADRDPLDAL